MCTLLALIMGKIDKHARHYGLVTLHMCLFISIAPITSRLISSVQRTS